MLGWALNEQDNIESYLQQAEAFLTSVSDDFELIVIDDGSTDATWEMLQRLGATRPWLRPIRNGRNRGVGYNYGAAIKAASKEYFLVQTLDWSYDITALGTSFDLLRRYDVLQGVRPTGRLAAAMGARSDTNWKAGVSLINYGLIRLLFRMPVGDFQNVTVCPTRLAQPLTLESDSSFANPEVMLKTWWQGASIYEVAVPFRKRERGVATGTRWRSIARSVRDILRCWFVWVALGRQDRSRKGMIVRLNDRVRQAA